MSEKIPLGPTGEPLDVLVPGELYALRNDKMMIQSMDMFVHALPDNFRAIRAVSKSTFDYVAYVPIKMTDARQSQGVAPSVNRTHMGVTPSEAAEKLTTGSVRPASAAEALMADLDVAMSTSTKSRDK